MATYTSKSDLQKFYRSKKKKNNFLENAESNISTSRIKKLTDNKSGIENFSSLKGRIDDYDAIFSTSQLTNIDYSKFENHVFFDSAEAKTTYAFSNIINNFPYDSSKKEIENFIVNLDGYSNYILENKILKKQGRYKFDGTFYIDIKDDKKIQDGKITSKIKILEKDTTLQFWITPSLVNSNYIVAQKMFIGDTNEGFSINVENIDDKYCKLTQHLINEDQSYKTSILLEKGATYNVCFANKSVVGRISTTVYINAKKSNAEYAGAIDLKQHRKEYTTAGLIIGGGNIYDEVQYGLSECILDDFLIQTNILPLNKIISNIEEGSDSSDSVQVLYRFNEVAENYANRLVVVDSSGNKLHGIIRNLDNSEVTVEKLESIRLDSTDILYEKSYYTISLFPDISVTNLNYNQIVVEAKRYDKFNPNLVFKLFPKYLFLEGSDKSSLDNQYYNNNGIQNEPANHYLVNLLLTWGRFFDNLKCFVDALSDILDVDYDNINDSDQSSAIIKLAAKSLGYDFNEIFDSPTIEKLAGIGLTHEKVKSERTIRDIQNILWKRLLINTQDVLRSKGTINSIKSAFNIFGVDHTKFINVAEFTSQNKINYNLMFNRKNKRINMLSFDRDIGKQITYDAQGFPTNSYVLEHEVQDLCDFNADCCWNIEFYTRFNYQKKDLYKSSQSLVKLVNNNNNDLLLNVVFTAKNDSKLGDIKAYVDLEGSGNTTEIIIENIDLFASDTWYTSIYCKKLNVDSVEFGLVLKKSCDESDFFTKKIKNIEIKKSQQFQQNATISFGPRQLSQIYQDKDYTTDFEGLLAGIKVWTDALSERDMFIHAKDPTSVSKENTLSELSFYKNIQKNLSIYTSFEEVTEDTEITGNTFFYNHNNIDSLNGRFKLIGEIVSPSECFKSIEHPVLEQNYMIDFPSNFKKINIASFENDKEYNYNRQDNIRMHNSEAITSYNNKRQVVIEFSSVKMLNEDINRTIDAYDFFTEAVINSTSRFDYNYASIDNIRRQYFERLESEINYKPIYQIFKYFENIMEEILYSLVPQNVNYNGFTYVVESHILERNKYQYKMGENRVPAWQRSSNHNYYQENKSSSEFGRIISTERLNDVL
jgi:hypothetical protein